MCIVCVITSIYGRAADFRRLDNLFTENSKEIALCFARINYPVSFISGYINESGTLKLDRFEKFMERLSLFDMIQFSDHYADLKYFESKTGRPLTEASDKVSRIKSEGSEETMSPKRLPDKEFEALLRSAAEMVLI